MLSGKIDRMFLPVWRGGQMLFFTNYSEGGSSRLSYLVAAATEKGATKVVRTGLAAMSNQEIERCQQLADNGSSTQLFFDAVGSGNLDRFSSQLADETLPIPNGSNRLIYICLYLDFLRKYAVDEEVVRIYSQQTPEARFNTEKAHGIYKILSMRMQPERAGALFDEDIKVFKPAGKPSLGVSNFFRSAAMAKAESSDFEKAEELMLRAVKAHDTEDKWRRLGEFAVQYGNAEKAVEYYYNAHSKTQLPPPSALAMVKLLLEIGKFDEAEPFIQIFEGPYPDAAINFREKLANITS